VMDRGHNFRKVEPGTVGKWFLTQLMLELGSPKTATLAGIVQDQMHISSISTT